MKKFFGVLAGLLTGSVLVLGAGEKASEPLRIADTSSGAALALRTAALALKLEDPSFHCEIIRMKPEDALRLFQQEQIDLLIGAEGVLPKSSGEVRFAVIAAILLANEANTAKIVLTMKNLPELLTENPANWKNAGGKNAEVHRYWMAEESDIFELAARKFSGRRAMREGTVFVRDAGSLLQLVRAEENALGISPFPYPAENAALVRVLALNGVLPTQENILSGRYELAEALKCLPRKGAPETAKRFAALLASGIADEELRQSGYVPLRPLPLKKSDR